MAVDTRDRLTNEDKVKLLAAHNSKDNNYLSDQNIHEFGSNRRGEILGKIGDDGRPFYQQYRDYLLSL